MSTRRQPVSAASSSSPALRRFTAQPFRPPAVPLIAVAGAGNGLTVTAHGRLAEVPEALEAVVPPVV